MWLILLVAIVPRDPVADDLVDSIERNNFYDEHGKLVFQQWIFRREYEEIGQRVIAWRLIKPNNDRTAGGNTLIFNEGNTLRRIRSRTPIYETWTQRDPELMDRQWLSKEKRPELDRGQVLKWPTRKP